MQVLVLAQWYRLFNLDCPHVRHLNLLLPVFRLRSRRFATLCPIYDFLLSKDRLVQQRYLALSSRLNFLMDLLLVQFLKVKFVLKGS